jgi:hypothetical protein
VFKKAIESSTFFDKAFGYAVFPTIGKAGVGLGGAFGKGQAYEKGQVIGDTSMTQVTAGWQLGGEAFSQIIFFEDKRALSGVAGPAPSRSSRGSGVFFEPGRAKPHDRCAEALLRAAAGQWVRRSREAACDERGDVCSNGAGLVWRRPGSMASRMQCDAPSAR